MIYKLLDFLRGGPGMVLSLIVTILLSFYFIRTERERSSDLNPSPKLAETDLITSEEIETPRTINRRNLFQPFIPLPPKPVPALTEITATPVEPATVESPPKPVRKLIQSYAPSPEPARMDAEPPKPKPPWSSRIGSLIPCRLVHSVVAGQQPTPITAITTADIKDASGRTLPAGTTIHGQTASIHANTLSANPNWRIGGSTINATILSRYHNRKTGFFTYGTARAFGFSLIRG